MAKLDASKVDELFAQAPEEIAKGNVLNAGAQLKAEVKGVKGETLSEGALMDVQQDQDQWVAKVAQMSLSVKVTPKIRDVFVSVEKSLTVDVNTRDSEVVQAIWEQMQETVLTDTIETVVKAATLLNKAV